jgi:hypothetical protein
MKITLTALIVAVGGLVVSNFGLLKQVSEVRAEVQQMRTITSLLMAAYQSDRAKEAYQLGQEKH